MWTTYEVSLRKIEDSAKMVKKITIIQQRSTEQCSAVDSRRRLKNLKMSVSQSMSAVLKQSV